MGEEDRPDLGQVGAQDVLGHGVAHADHLEGEDAREVGKEQLQSGWVGLPEAAVT